MAVDLDVSPILDSISKLSDAEKAKMSNLIYKKYIETAEIGKSHPIQTGVICNTPIPMADKGNNWEYMKSTAGLDSQCDDIDCDLSITYSPKLWNPVPYACSPLVCLKDIACGIKDYFRVNCAETDPTGTDYVNALASVLGENLTRSHWLKAWFGDTDSDNLAFNANDGFFKQLLAIATAPGAQRMEIAENAELTKAEQLALAADTGFNVFNWMYNNQPNAIFGDSDVVIYATRTLCKNYLQWLNTEKVVGCCERDPLTATYNINKLSIFGIPIVMRSEWDEIILNVADFDDGTVYDAPHRAVLSPKVNLPIATCESDQLSNFDIRFDPFTEKTKFVSRYTIDAKVIEDSEILLAL